MYTYLNKGWISWLVIDGCAHARLALPPAPQRPIWMCYDTRGSSDRAPLSWDRAGACGHPASWENACMVERVGQQLGHYHLQRVLGRGAFAEVYLAQHRYLEVPAAIK